MKLRNLSEKFVDQEAAYGELKPRKGGVNRDWSDYDQTKTTQKKNILKQNGWREIGSGFFSTVYANRNVKDKVLKVFKGQDKGWTRYYSLAKRSDNPHFPIVSRLGVLDLLGEPHYCCLMEKLEPAFLNHDSETNDFAWAIKRYMHHRDEYFVDLYEEKYPDLMEALNEIGKLALPWTPGPNSRLRSGDTMKYALDMKPDNIMWRGDIPVFTDPVYAIYSKRRMEE